MKKKDPWAAFTKIPSKKRSREEEARPIPEPRPRPKISGMPKPKPLPLPAIDDQGHVNSFAVMMNSATKKKAFVKKRTRVTAAKAAERVKEYVDSIAPKRADAKVSESSGKDEKVDEKKANDDKKDVFLGINRAQAKEAQLALEEFEKTFQMPENMIAKRKDAKLTEALELGGEIELWIEGISQTNISCQDDNDLRARYQDQDEEAMELSTTDELRAMDGPQKMDWFQGAGLRAAARTHGRIAAKTFEESGAKAMTLIQLTTTSDGGDPVRIDVSGFWPYMFAKIPTALVRPVSTERGLKAYRVYLEERMRECIRRINESKEKEGKKSMFQYVQPPYVTGLEIVNNTTAQDYQARATQARFKISVCISSLIPILRNLLYIDGLDTPGIKGMETLHDHVKILRSPNVATINQLDFTYIDTSPPLLRCSYDTYLRMHMRFYISPASALRFLNKQLANKHLPIEAVSWEPFANVEEDCVANPAAMDIVCRLKSPSSDGIPNVILVPDPVVARDLHNGAVAFELPDSFVQRIKDMHWMQSEVELLFARKLLGKDRLEEKKHCTLYQGKYLVLAVGKPPEKDKKAKDKGKGKDNKPTKECGIQCLAGRCVCNDPYQQAMGISAGAAFQEGTEDALTKYRNAYSPLVPMTLPTHMEPFECDVQFTMRFLVDHGLRASSWLRIPKGKYEVHYEDGYDTPIVRVSHENVSLSPGDSPTRKALLVEGTLDIECSNLKGNFPNPLNDSVCAIGFSLTNAGDSRTKPRTWIGCTGTCTKNEGEYHLSDFPYEEKTLDALEFKIRPLRHSWNEIHDALKARIDKLDTEKKKKTAHGGLRFSNDLLIEAMTFARFDEERDRRIAMFLRTVRQVVLGKVEKTVTSSLEKIVTFLKTDVDHRIPESESELLGLYQWLDDFNSIKMLSVNRENQLDAERDLLRAFAVVLKRSDPDIVTGWNVFGFDFYYLFRRAKVLNVPEIFLLGRFGAPASLRHQTYQTRAVGVQKRIVPTVPGRIMLDALGVFRSDFKYEMYTLGFVSTKLLNMTKVEVHHSQIGILANGTPEMRKRLMDYLKRDTVLPPALLTKKNSISNAIQLSRTCGIPIEDIYARGQSIRTKFILLEKFRKENMVIPYYLSRKQRVDPDVDDIEMLVCEEDKGDADAVNKNRNQFAGATVIEPFRGYYDTPTSTLDFNSLYPSIQRAKNVCYTTLVRKERFHEFKDEDLFKFDAGLGNVVAFVKHHVFPGVIPAAQTEFTNKRNDVRKGPVNSIKTLKKELEILEKKVEAKTEEEEIRIRTIKDVLPALDSLQLAIKTSSNSMYGFPTGNDFREVFVSAVVTLVGRQNILFAKDFIESTFTIANGYPANAKVLYGDTDSIIIDWGDPNMANCIRYSRLAQAELAKRLPPPLFMEFENVYKIYILLNKKRYAAAILDLDHWDKTGEEKLEPKAKGLESVRRDNNLLVRETITEMIKKLTDVKETKTRKEAIQKTIAYVREQAVKLLNGEFDMSLLTHSTKVGENPKVINASLAVSQKMKVRDEDSAPIPGDRIPYILVECIKGSKVFEMAEDPVHALQKDMPIAYRTIYETKFKPAILRMMRVPLLDRDNPDHKIPEEKKAQKKKFEQLDKINDAMLFGPVEAKRRESVVIHKRLSQHNPLSKHVVRSSTCLECHVPLDAERGKFMVCVHCDARKEMLLASFEEKTLAVEMECKKQWDACYSCDSMLQSPDLCANKDCRQFYSRQTIRKKAKDMRAKLHKAKQALATMSKDVVVSEEEEEEEEEFEEHKEQEDFSSAMDVY